MLRRSPVLVNAEMPEAEMQVDGIKSARTHRRTADRSAAGQHQRLAEMRADAPLIAAGSFFFPRARNSWYWRRGTARGQLIRSREVEHARAGS